MTLPFDTDEDSEVTRLTRFRLAAPPEGLKERVLERAQRPAPVSRARIALRWALAAWVATQFWGGWMERNTAERMARLSVSHTTEAASRTNGKASDDVAGRVAMALLHQRYTLPLGPGIGSTHMDIVYTSIQSPREGAAS